MCHLLLALPVLALPVFWLWPPSLAGPVYAVVTAVSLSVYAFALAAMRRPVRIGRGEMLQATGTVLGKIVLETTGREGYRVRVHGEVWLARSERELVNGDRVRITDVEGTTLRVEPDHGA